MADPSASTEGWPRLACDDPAEGAPLAPDAVVTGWAFSPAGIRQVAIWLDGQRLGDATHGTERRDVGAAHPDVPEALASGFRFRLAAPPAPPLPRAAELRIVAEDGEGRTAEIARPVELVDETPVTLVCDAPAAGEMLNDETVVSGWAFSPAGVRRVSVLLDGQRLGEATIGQERSDVAAAFPQWSGAARSGFRYRLGTAPPARPRPMSELRVVAEDAQGRTAEMRRPVAVRQPIETFEPPPPPPLAGSLDIPKVRGPEEVFRHAGWSSPLVVFGWAIDVAGIERIEVAIDGEFVATAEHGLPREDVEVLRWDYRRLGLASRSGWLAVIPTEGIPPGEHAASAVIHGKSGSMALGPTPFWIRPDDVRADPERRQRLEQLLRCPSCGQPLRREGEALVCVTGDRTIRANEYGTLLLDETYAGLDWRQAVATSHGYPPEASDVITECADGLVLDIGAGLRENLANVIQLDAIAFPTTDVSANAEALPFADESFDGVVACNLLEHVSTPNAVVQEIRRVCKKGGRIYADFTSVHPYHGFPHHYFNATETGLDWMMREVGGASGTVGVTPPQITVQLVLDHWLGSLEDPGTRQYVQQMTVGDFLALLRSPGRDHDRWLAMGNVYPNGRRLVPPKVTFTGTRER